MKKCTKCGVEKTLTEFFKRKMSKDGLQPICKICDTKSRKVRKDADPEKERAYQKQYRETHREQKRATDWWCYWANRDARNEYGRAYHARRKDDPEYISMRYIYRKVNAEEASNRVRQRRQNNPEPFRERRRQHYRNNKSDYIANAASRRARELRATPDWVNFDELKNIYFLREQMQICTGIEYHIDHIVPLTHPLVCGLHVPWNLQILTREENLAKGNKFVVE